MTTFEKYINIKNKRQRYEDNIDVINKLKNQLLDDYDITSPELIKESIDQVKLEQETILNELKVNNLSEMIELEKDAYSKVDFKNMKKNLYRSMSNELSAYEVNKKKKEERQKRIQELETIKSEVTELIDVTKKVIKQFGNKIDEKDIFDIKLSIKELEEVVETDNIDEIKVTMKKLKDIDYELASRFYDGFNIKNDTEEEDIIEYEDEVIEVEDNVNDDKTEVLTSDMRPNRNDDKTDVLTSDMRPNRNDDKTDVLTSDMKPNRNDDKTDVLTSDMKYKNAEIIDFEAVRKELFKDAHIVFDGTYKLYYNKDRDFYEFNVDTEILQNNISSLAAYDFRIMNKLKEFDDKNHTKLYDRYMENKLPVHYDLEAAKMNKIRKSSLNKLVEITGRQIKCGESRNTTVVKTKKSSFRVAAAAIGVAAMTLIGSFIGFGMKKSNNYDNATAKQTISTVQEMDDAGASDASYDSIEITEDAMINTSFDEIELVSENVMEDVQNENNSKSEEVVDVIEEETNELKIGDVITLNDNIDLYTASTDSNPNGNTSYLESNSYKVGLVSIVDEGEVVKLLDGNDTSINEVIEECISKYGDDIEVFENLDLLDKNGGVITEHVGWVENEELGKVLVK